MMIDLTDLAFEATEPSMPDAGVLQQPPNGGVTNKIGRLGGGFVSTLTIPAKPFAVEGQRLIARLQLAKRDGAIVRYTQPGFNIGAPGEPAVDGAVAGGMTLPVTGATPNYAVAQGQALNVVKSGHYYLYFAAEQAVLDASGAGDIALTSPLRTQLAGAEDVKLKPVIEGWIVGDNLAWAIGQNRMVALQLTIQERA